MVLLNHEKEFSQCDRWSAPNRPSPVNRRPKPGRFADHPGQIIPYHCPGNMPYPSGYAKRPAGPLYLCNPTKMDGPQRCYRRGPLLEWPISRILCRYRRRSFIWEQHCCCPQATYPKPTPALFPDFLAKTSYFKHCHPAGDFLDGGIVAYGRLAPGQRFGLLFGLAPGGVFHASDVTIAAVRSYRTFSPLPAGPADIGGLFSVALSRIGPALRPSRRVGITHHRTLRCSDFPPGSRRAITWPPHIIIHCKPLLEKLPGAATEPTSRSHHTQLTTQNAQRHGWLQPSYERFPGFEWRCPRDGWQR